MIKVEPDGFKITKLAAGEKAPQFVVVSFDGVGWHEKWQYWKDIQTKVPFHFTGFLSGTYMLTTETKEKYQGPGHNPGAASISWNEPADLVPEINDLNDAINRGDEIGTHFNGHFCEGNDPSGNVWNTADWNNELDQFFSLVANVDANNGITDKLNIDPSEIRGGRTPCLEGHAEDLFPAYKAHNMDYDSSFTKHGISWPLKSKENKIWQIGMAEYPIHGTDHFQITMDYNFYYTQREANSEGVTEAESAQDSQQVLDTYRDMYNATFNGNRAPLILGNHFNSWNNNAYSDAIANFVLETCGKADTYCVTNRDLIDWMEAQDPAVLADLQNQDPEV
ncbi:polysaccharide deacetylase [Nakamurella sp. YIM 132087]|uniref:Polysaccharide deacetylase n=1 Tax=Nakamurella alba TaxID=2665158 RepID=A0A7K1FN87_9ACTN|nr:polysaccharide deacetylase [Nakamurella alba]MTD15625.1 polysaccharide deacetylase [Nakamurella alba]